MKLAREWNFDGLVGPTHNYAGLSVGNVASIKNAQVTSNPRAAALQGLEKMWALQQLGIPQGVLAPQERPNLRALRRLGFTGSDGDILKKASQVQPQILAACFSASSMWTANAATVSPSADASDHRVHLTPANLTSKYHRSLESKTTQKILQSVFPNEKYFAHHSPLPSADAFADEGAANHTRLCENYGDPGVEFFVYGRTAFDTRSILPKKYPARQTREASEAIIRTHGLDPEKVVLAQQNPDVVDQGVFHNDVISVGNRNLLFYHSEAFVRSAQVIEEIEKKMKSPFQAVEVTNADVPVPDVVQSYLFNSQLISLPSGDTALIAPEECRKNERVWNYLNGLVGTAAPIQKIHVYNVTQSMQNGGGPACLRLRVVLTDAEAKAINQGCALNEGNYLTLQKWIEKYYRDRMSTNDFLDVQIVDETRRALDELTQILQLGSVYEFQQNADR